jgi:hypothetical protein
MRLRASRNLSPEFFMKKVILGGAAALVATVAVAQTAVPQAQPTHTRAQVAAKVQQHFTRVDANKDGAITQAEVQALRATRGERLAKAAGRDGGRAPGELFARLDTNRDGQVTRAEFDARRAARAQAQAPAPERAQRGEQMFARLDTDRNGAISKTELGARRQLRAQRLARHGKLVAQDGGRFGGHMFAMADADKDGRVTLQEAQSAALRHFDMADANKDGQVTREERRQMRQQMRGHGGHAGHAG